MSTLAAITVHDTVFCRWFPIKRSRVSSMSAARATESTPTACSCREPSSWGTCRHQIRQLHNATGHVLLSLLTLHCHLILQRLLLRICMRGQLSNLCAAVRFYGLLGQSDLRKLHCSRPGKAWSLSWLASGVSKHASILNESAEMEVDEETI